MEGLCRLTVGLKLRLRSYVAIVLEGLKVVSVLLLMLLSFQRLLALRECYQVCVMYLDEQAACLIRL